VFVTGRGPIAAQTPRTQAPCNGQVVAEVLVQAQGPRYGGLFSRAPWLGRLATAVHDASTPRMIENLVLLKQGDHCSPLLRSETERLLRAQPFLAEATVTAYPAGRDSVVLEVVTVDEPSMLGSIGLSSDAPYLHALRLGNSNLRGRGVSALAGWKDGGFYRDTYQARYSNFQLFSEPIQMHLTAIRRDHGYDVNGEVSYPFFTDLQARAWRIAGGANDLLAPFRSPGREPVTLGIRRQFADAGAVARIGPPGRLAIAGASLSFERATPDELAFTVTDSGLFPDTGTGLQARYAPFRTARVNLLLGYRQVNFLRVSGFDALAGTQDVRRGVQASFAVGRSLETEGTIPGEVFVAGALYGGFGSPTSFAGLEILAEGTRLRGGDWQRLLLGGRFGFYIRPHNRHTIAGSLEYSAGRKQWLPFQLALGDPRGGVRGYEDAQVGGAARLVTRLEERWRVGNIRGTGDVGVAVFTESGRLWAGDAPYGRTTTMMPSVGVALLAAVPPRSRRIWRLDIAFPLNDEAGARWGMRLTNEDRSRAFWIEPNDVRRNRDRSGLMMQQIGGDRRP
jgi:hypothetical protein